MLHPELTASATRVQAEQIRRAGTQVHASCNRTCELGMTRAVGNEYSHILELLAEVTGARGAGRG
jgi:D-lactate dehydrogenase